MLYLMKLHHGSEFGTRAGAYWRLLFTLALMPWMRAYRVRLSGKETKDTFEDEFIDDTTSYAGSEMTPYGLQLELDITQIANDSLTKRNKELKDVLDNTKQKLRTANRNVKKLERKLQRAEEKAAKNAAKENETKTANQTKAKRQPRAATKDPRWTANKQRNSIVSDQQVESKSSPPHENKQTVAANEESFASSGSTQQLKGRGAKTATNTSSSSKKSSFSGGEGARMPMPENVDKVLDRPFASLNEFQISMDQPQNHYASVGSRPSRSFGHGERGGGGLQTPKNIDQILDHAFMSRNDFHITMDVPLDPDGNHRTSGSVEEDSFESESDENNRSQQITDAEDFESESDEDSFEDKNQEGQNQQSQQLNDEQESEEDEDEYDSYTESTYEDPPSTIPGPGTKQQSFVSGVTFLESHHKKDGH